MIVVVQTEGASGIEGGEWGKAHTVNGTVTSIKLEVCDGLSVGCSTVAGFVM